MYTSAQLQSDSQALSSKTVSRRVSARSLQVSEAHLGSV